MLLVDLIPTVVASAAAVLDLKYRRIPDWLTLGALCIGLGVQFSRSGASGIPVALAGAALGLVVLLPFYVMRAIGAGDVTRAAFGDLGSAGGHRTMAKAVLSLKEFLKGSGESPSGRVCQERIIQRFLRALGQNGKA